MDKTNKQKGKGPREDTRNSNPIFIAIGIP